MHLKFITYHIFRKVVKMKIVFVYSFSLLWEDVDLLELLNIGNDIEKHLKNAIVHGLFLHVHHHANVERVLLHFIKTWVVQHVEVLIRLDKLLVVLKKLISLEHEVLQWKDVVIILWEIWNHRVAVPDHLRASLHALDELCASLLGSIFL